MKIAVFASGTGTTLQALMDNQVRYDYQISLVVVNRVCQARDRAEDTGISTLLSKDWMQIDQVLAEHQIQMIVLAGFLAIIPQWFCEKWDNKIINIHPALLPKYGGKGFYGEHVHEAVVAAKEEFSGITIHYVNECYDSGAIIFQAKVALEEGETADSLAAKIHKLEYQHYPEVIEELIKK